MASVGYNVHEDQNKDDIHMHLEVNNFHPSEHDYVDPSQSSVKVESGKVTRGILSMPKGTANINILRKRGSQEMKGAPKKITKKAYAGKKRVSEPNLDDNTMSMSHSDGNASMNDSDTEVSNSRTLTNQSSPLASSGKSKQVSVSSPNANVSGNVKTSYYYMKEDKGPFKAIVTYLKPGSVDSLDVRPPSEVEVARDLIKFGIRFLNLEKFSRFKWTINFDNGNDANNATKNQFLKGSKYTIEIPWFMIFRKVIVKGIPVSVPLEEFLQELTASNPHLRFDNVDIQRLKTRRTFNGEVSLVETTSVKLNLRASEVPSNVMVWRTRVGMSPYVRGIRQCFNCGQLSHSTNFCKNIAKCLTCGQISHDEQNPCSGETKCINCDGAHRSLSKECPEVILKKRIMELMAIDNIDFNTARRLITQGSIQETVNFSRLSPQDFPSLPRRTGVSTRSSPLSSQPTRTSGSSSLTPGRSFANILTPKSSASATPSTGALRAGVNLGLGPKTGLAANVTTNKTALSNFICELINCFPPDFLEITTGILRDVLTNTNAPQILEDQPN